MAANKDNDGLFHWNFNLADSDSDFTDIEYTKQQTPAETKGEPADMEPVIFVNGDYKPKDAGDFVGRYMENAGQNARAEKPQTVKVKKDSENLEAAIAYANTKTKKEAAAKKEAAESKKETAAKPAGKTVKPANNKYIAKRKSVRWQPIALIAAVVLVIALLVIIFWPKNDKPKDPKTSTNSAESGTKWTAVTQDSEIWKLMDSYFQAKVDADAPGLRLILVPEAHVSAGTIGMEARLYNGYVNREIQTYPGINKGESVICATYDTELAMLPGGVVPTLNWFYARKDSNNKLRLMTTEEMNAEESGETKAYVEEAAEELTDFVKKISDRYIATMNENPRVAQYMENIRNNDPYNVPPESTKATEPETTTEAQTEDPEQPSWTAPHGTEEDTSRTFCAYVNANSVRMRSTPSLDQDNVINIFDKGYYVYVIAVLEDWYKIDDVMAKNDATGEAQNPSGDRGYIYKDFITEYYSDLN